jgi:opacity protein-like surface antigen
MGGAATALADDGGGPYYNPGGIAFAMASSLSLSASVYGFVGGTETNGVAPGHNFTYSDINTFPVSTSAVYKWGPRAEPDGAPVNALAVSVFVPDSLVLDDRKTADNVQVSGLAGQQTQFLTQSEQSIWAGATYARRFGRLGLGVSGYVVIGTHMSSGDISFVPPSNTLFAIISGREDQTNVGLVGALGARYDVSDHLKLGLSVFTMEAGIYQDRREYARYADNSIPLIYTRNQGGLHATPTLPWRIQLGGAWVDGPWTFAADAMILPPLDVRDDHSLASEGFERHIKRNLVVNGSVGAEYVVRGKYPVRAGFFTDFAASPSPHAYNDNGTQIDDPHPNTDNDEHVNRYGGSLSVGYRTEHTATDVGTIISYGSGKVTGFDLSNFYATPVHDVTNVLAYIFLASSYIF